MSKQQILKSQNTYNKEMHVSSVRKTKKKFHSDLNKFDNNANI